MPVWCILPRLNFDESFECNGRMKKKKTFTKVKRENEGEGARIRSEKPPAINPTRSSKLTFSSGWGKYRS